MVWGLYAVVALCVLVTYSRVAPDELYHVSHGGLAGGLGRVLVFINFPTALAAIAVLALVTDRLGLRWPAGVALVLCLVIFVPGVVDQGDLDAKWINVLPALGVTIVLTLTILAVRAGGTGGAGSPNGDRIRIVLASVLALLALPWIFAEVGVYVSDVPGLASIFRSKQVFEGHPSVHLGEHHGLQGLLLIVTALLLSRELPRMHPTRLRTGLAAYLSLMIPYGIGNMANDAWTEQVVKRGWTSWAIPDMLRPSLSWIWGVTILAAAAIYLTALQPGRDQASTDG
ncbi:MAG TPA: hypothetical protein VK488_07565 [Gaiellaceae bacterium]|nr:hypothetical protein [Gaiellaceae bacterium]